MDKTGTFWQFPVITEKAFAEQHLGRAGFVAFPWATVIDRKVAPSLILSAWAGLGGRTTAVEMYTCCQHIAFRRLANLWHELGIRKVYAAHRAEGEDWLSVPGSKDKILLLPCALYAVNAEDTIRSATFRTLSSSPGQQQRPILFSFLGAYQPSNYLSDIRPRIFETWGDLPKPVWLLTDEQRGGGDEQDGVDSRADSIWVEDTGRLWHFHDAVYNRQNQNPTAKRDASKETNQSDRYTTLLFLSSFSLCPSGSGPNSIRLWESLAAGSIPVILSDRISLPRVPGLREVCITFPERGEPLEKLEAQLRAMPHEEIALRRQKCFELYAIVRQDLAFCDGIGLSISKP